MMIRLSELTAYEDEPLTGTASDTDQGPDSGISELVATEVERPRAGPMRDIVATIQPEQDDLVRAPLDVTLCVQGAPGTGKTAVGLHRVAEIMEGLLDSDTPGGYRYGPGRNALAQRIAHAVLVRMERRGEAPDDRVQNQVARSKPVTQILDQVWPKLTPERVLLRLRSDPDSLASAAGGELTDEEQRLLLWAKPYRSPNSARWSAADVVLLDELADLIEPTRSVSHLVVDEAQDLTPMQLRSLGRRCRAATVLGDLAQATTSGSGSSWKEIADTLGVADAQLTELNRGFRVPAQIIEYAARLLPEIAPDLTRPDSVRQAPGTLEITRAAPPSPETTDDSALFTVLADRCERAREHGGSVGVIVDDAQLPDVIEGLREAGPELAVVGETEDAMETARVVAVPAGLVKGLEFDTVLVVEPSRIVASGPRGLHRLYVALTRAVSRLEVVHSEPLPAVLAG